MRERVDLVLLGLQLRVLVGDLLDERLDLVAQLVGLALLLLEHLRARRLRQREHCGIGRGPVSSI